VRAASCLLMSMEMLCLERLRARGIARRAP
jgi:hypothetical protein